MPGTANALRGPDLVCARLPSELHVSHHGPGWLGAMYEGKGIWLAKAVISAKLHVKLLAGEHACLAILEVTSVDCHGSAL